MHTTYIKVPQPAFEPFHWACKSSAYFCFFSEFGKQGQAATDIVCIAKLVM